METRSVDARASSNDDEVGGWDNDNNEPNFVVDDVWKVLLSNEDESVGQEEPDDTVFAPCCSGENVPIIMEQEEDQQEVPNLCRHVGLNGKDYLYDLAKNDSRGYIPVASKSIPIPAELKLPASHQIGMHPLELELMLFIHDHNLPPSLYDGIIKWAKKANESGYDFGSRTHQSLKKQLDSVLPPSLHGGSLLSREFKGTRPDEAPVKLWYFNPLTLFARAMRDPVIMKHFICYPQTKRTACGVRIFDEFVSADAFHNAFKNSPASSDDGKHLRPGCLFVSVGEFDDGSCTSALMRKSEHPYLLTMMNLSLEARKSVESWFLVSFLPDVEVSDLEKSEKNQKANGDLALCRLKLYHEMTSFLLAAFKDRNKYYNMWVHGLGWTKVYFQVGLVIGDTEQHNRICGFRGGNGLFRRHSCRDCSVLTLECDNPNVKCERTKVEEKKEFLKWIFHGASKSIDGKLRSIDDHFESSQSFKGHASVDDWCRVISQAPVMPALFDHDFGGDEEGILGSCPFEVLHQFQLGLVKYVLVSLFTYRPIPSDFLFWLEKRSNPDSPGKKAGGGCDDGMEEDDEEEEDGNLSIVGDSSSIENDECDDDDDVGSMIRSGSTCSNPNLDDRSEITKFSDWMKTRPNAGMLGKKSARMFSCVYFEKAARYINDFLQRQSDRSIPGLSYRSGLTAVTKMSGQELPGLCLMTIFSMGGMFGAKNSDLEDDFTLLLWLCIAMNDTLGSSMYTEECVEVLESRVVRFLTVTRALIGDQREYASAAGLRLAKFHALLHYPAQIRKFGSTLNSFGGFLESFLKNFLKYPSKRVNGHLHRHQHDLLVRSLETRQFRLAKQILFPPDFLTSLPAEADMVGGVPLDEGSSVTTSSSQCGSLSGGGFNIMVPKRAMFTVARDKDENWVMANIATDKPVDPPNLRNTGNDFFRLYHPDSGKPDENQSVRDIVHSAIQRAKDDRVDGVTKEVTKVEFHYQVKVKLDSGEKNIILRCNPKWSKGSANLEPKTWYDWIEVTWTRGNQDHGGGSVEYVVPAILRLWGNVLYSDGTTQLLASVRSLKSTSDLRHHDRMFFARGDYMDDSRASYCVVDYESIKSTGFVVPAIPPRIKGRLPKNPSESLSVLVGSNYFVALPSRDKWKNVGWDRKLSSEK